MAKSWKARWICDPRFADLRPIDATGKEKDFVPRRDAGAFAHREDLQNQHWLVRRAFDLPAVRGPVFLDLSADDRFWLFVNGVFVAEGPAPGYPFRYPYERLDLGPYLHAGRNVLAVHVYYQGLLNTRWCSGDYRQGLIAELSAPDDPDAPDDPLLWTDATWRFLRTEAYAGTDTVGYRIQYLEHTDSRLVVPDWTEPGFDDAAWEPCAERPDDDHVLVLQQTPPLQIEDLEPASVETVAPGHLLVDFGQGIVGSVRLRAHGTSGQVVEIRHAEELADPSAPPPSRDGRIRYEMRCNCTYSERWTLSGGDDVFFPLDSKSFRYVEVLAPEGVALSPRVVGVFRHYPFDPAASDFRSSDPQLDRIWAICRNAVVNCAQEQFVDCASREKGQYLGDTTIVGPAHVALSGDARLFRKALFDFADSARISPGLLCISPSGAMQEAVDYSLQFPLQLLAYYRWTGDLDAVRALVPVAERMVGFFGKYRRADGLLAGIDEERVFMDWPPNLRDGYDFDLAWPGGGTGCHNVVNGLYYAALQSLDELRDVLGIPFVDEKPRLRAAFLKTFLSPDTGLFVDAEGSAHSSLHANLFPLLHGFVPAGPARTRILDFVKSKRMSCGVYMAYFLLKALAACGEHAFLYELLTCDDLHSWKNMLREGATTCFEAWGKDLKWNTSLCHAWASAPVLLLVEDVVGLKPAAPGWTSVAFAPRIPAALRDLSLTITVPTGVVRVEHHEGRTELRVPDGVRVVRS